MHPYLLYYFKLVKRLLPTESQRSVIGLDVGTSFCRAVEVARKNGVLELVRWAVEPVDSLGEKAAIAKIASAFDLVSKPQPIISAVSGKGTLIRYIEMPRMTLMELKRAFVIEADKYFPFPKESIYTDCFILDPHSRDKKMSVLIAAVKKDIIDARCKLMKESGPEANVIMLNSLAVANAFSYLGPVVAEKDGGASKGSSPETVAVLDVGESVTNLMIITGNVPRFTRDIFIGTTEIYKRVANITGISPIEARNLVASPGGRQEEIRHGVEAVTSNLISEIRLSFDYFITEKNMQISKLYLIGEGALVPGVETIFKENFDLPVAGWNPFERMSLGVAVNREELYRQSPRLVTALGLALNEDD